MLMGACIWQEMERQVAAAVRGRRGPSPGAAGAARAARGHGTVATTESITVIDCATYGGDREE